MYNRNLRNDTQSDRFLNGVNLFTTPFIYIYVKKYNFLKIANASCIFSDVKSIIQLPRRHFFADVK